LSARGAGFVLALFGATISQLASLFLVDVLCPLVPVGSEWKAPSNAVGSEIMRVGGVEKATL
jgi:hypothetical protein